MRLFFLIYRLLCMSCHRRRPLFELHVQPTLQFNGVTFRWDGLKFVRESRAK